MIIGLFVFLAILVLTSLKKSFERLNYLKISISSMAILIGSLITIIYLISIADSIPKIGSLKHMLNFDEILHEISMRNKNRAAFPEWTVPKTEFELFYKAPIRVIYFMLSPFPWDIKSPGHLFGLFDGMFHILLLILFIKNFKSIWSDRTLRIILIILASYVALYGLASGNFGTGLRHRTKLIILSILIVSPWIPKLVFNKKQRNTNNKNYKKFDV